MPLNNKKENRRVFLEETCLCAKPVLPFAVLKRRLYRRLEAMNIKVKRIIDEEWSFIPVGGPLPVNYESSTILCFLTIVLFLIIVFFLIQCFFYYSVFLLQCFFITVFLLQCFFITVFFYYSVFLLQCFFITVFFYYSVFLL